MELYIIRHAQSTNNVLGNPDRRSSDPPLTDLGQRQAEILAHHLAGGVQREPAPHGSDELRGYGITHLYCSPMWRALQTSRPIGEALGLAPEVWVDVHEHGGIYLDHGEPEGLVGYPGKGRSEILAEFPNYVLPESITERGWWNRGFEDRAGCIARAIRVTRNLEQRATSDEHVAIVCHGGFIDSLLKAVFNVLPGYPMWYYQYNTGISRIDFGPDGRVSIHYLNRVDHLPPELIS